MNKLNLDSEDFKGNIIYWSSIELLSNEDQNKLFQKIKNQGLNYYDYGEYISLYDEDNTKTIGEYHENV